MLKTLLLRLAQRSQSNSFLFLIILFFGCNFAFSQSTAYNYNFSESDGAVNTYTDLPTTGSSVIVASGTFTVIAAFSTQTLPVGFNFYYNGVSYNQVHVSDNGFILLGALGTTPFGLTAPLSGAGTYSGAIAGYATNLVGAIPTAEVKYDVIGTAPNRIFVVQYKDVQRRGAAALNGLINMQIRLYETSNNIEIIYKDLFASISTALVAGQVGLRGATNTDFNRRTNVSNAIYPATNAGTLNGILNTDCLVTLGQASGVASQGWKALTKFVWSPCFSPTGIAVAMQADNSTVDINWTNPSFLPAGGFDFEVRNDGLAPGSAGAFFTGNTSSYTAPIAGAPYTVSVIGLQLGITYRIYVKPNCKSGVWMPFTLPSNVPTTTVPSGLTVTPTCLIASLPYTQNFEGVVTPAIPNCTSGVTVIVPPATVPPAPMVTKDNTSTPLAGFTSKNLTTAGANAQDTWFFTQGLNFPSAGNYKVTYTYGIASLLAFNEQKMKVYYGATASVAGMTVLLADHSSIKSSPITNSINFVVAAAGTYYVGFQGYAVASQGTLQIDDIVVETSTCLPPTALTTGQVTQNSAIISWTAPVSAPSNGYEFVYSTSNTQPINTTPRSGTTAANVTLSTLTGLASSTTYYFWVRSVCGTNNSSAWSLSGTFTTLTPYVVSCVPSGLTFAQDPNGITNVTMGSINNTTGIEINNYGNYSNFSTNVAQSAVIPVSITYGTGFTYDTQIWVDWNDDGDFIDAGESVYTGVSTNANPTTLVASFTVPLLDSDATTTLGQHRMRIGGIDNPTFTGGALAPCRTGSFQVFEDYSIFVITPPPALTLSGSSSIICSGQSTTAITLTSNPSDFQVYSWSPSVGVTGTVVSGWTFNPTTTTTYILTATQTSGVYASNTASYSITVNQLPSTITITPAAATICQNATTGQILVATGGIVSGTLVANAGDNFNSATGLYTTTNNSTPLIVTTTNNPADAAWTLRNSPYTYGGTVFSSNDASQFYLSNSDDQGATGTTNTLLTSPSFNLQTPTFTSASLSFWHYYRGFGNGTAKVEVSVSGGAWNTLPGLSYTTANQGTPTNFVNVNYDLSAYVGSNDVRIRFNYENALFAWYWAVDNVKVTGSTISDIIWSPTTGLWLNSNLTTPYTGTAASTVYAAPTTTTVYSASATSPETCTNFKNVTVTVTNVNGGTVAAPLNNQTISCTSFISNVTLTGNTGSVVNWEYANNPAFTGAVAIPSSASITLTSAQMSAYTGVSYFRAVVATGSCALVYGSTVTITTTTTIWNGTSWSNGLPSATKTTIFNGNYSSSTDALLAASPTPNRLNACSVFVQSGTVTFNPNYVLNVERTVNSTGGLIVFEEGSSLVQVNLATNAPGVYSGGNSGPITYKRNTTNMNLFDYTYWSSPVYPQALSELSPFTLADKYHHFFTSGGYWQNVPGNSLMTPGKGYIIRAPQGHVNGTSFSGVFSGTNNAIPNGTPNNGTISIPIVMGTSNLNLIGNPYPSSVNAIAFLSDINNADFVEGTMYFWTHTTPISGGNYTAADYAIFNYSGSVATGPGTGTITPNGFVAAGQSFFIKGINPTSAPPAAMKAIFRNNMRSATQSNSQFFKSNDATSSNTSDVNNETVNSILNLEKNRFWLDITNNQGAFKQTLIGYIENATNGIDRGFDGQAIYTGSSVSLYSLIGSSKLGIQGRSLPFETSDIVPLGYSSSINGTYQISLSNFDGLFQDQEILIEDKLLNVIHNLKTGNYSFVSTIGTFEDRFQIRYTNALSTNQSTFSENSVIAFKQDQDIKIETSNFLIDSIEVYDIRGRKLFEKNEINSKEYAIKNLISSQQVLIVKITSEDGKIVNKKIIF